MIDSAISLQELSDNLDMMDFTSDPAEYVEALDRIIDKLGNENAVKLFEALCKEGATA